jgi:hypothetical protein
MSQQHQAQKTYTEADIQLAISDIQNQQFQSERCAVAIYKVWLRKWRYHVLLLTYMDFSLLAIHTVRSIYNPMARAGRHSSASGGDIMYLLGTRYSRTLLTNRLM